MANVELMPGIKSISGKVGNMIFKTYKNGKVRAFPAEQRKRRTKVTKAETSNRFNFGTIAVEVAKRMAAGDTRSKKELWAIVKKELAHKPKNKK